MEYAVSVIMCTYNPDYKKTKSTLNSIIFQRKIDFELIICDDGSKDALHDEIKNYLQAVGFIKYKFVKNKTNLGTVKNCLKGIQAASGKYVYLISPGDLLYDEFTLKAFYDFSQKNNSKIVFGKSIAYNKKDKIIKLFHNFQNPRYPFLYKKNKPLKLQQTLFFANINNILGSCYFRERNTALLYIKKIDNVCKYVEDNTSTGFYLADNNKLHFFDRFIVWYEYGTGISTNSDEKWKKIIDKDFYECKKKLNELYPNNSFIEYYGKQLGKVNKYVLLRKYPEIFFWTMIIRIIKKCAIVNISDIDIEQLKKWLK